MQAAQHKTLFLAAVLILSIQPLAAHTHVAQNSRPGLDTFKTSLHQEIELGSSLKALEIDASVRQTCVRSRSTGKERDAETGLDYFGARYLASAQGRFTSADPIFMTNQRISDPQQLNLYGYARNNPLLFIDPDGRDIRIAVTNVQAGTSYVNRFTQAEIQSSRGQLRQVREQVPTYRILVSNDSGSSFAAEATRDANRTGDVAQTRGSYGSDHEAPPGVYSGSVRNDGTRGFRIELSDSDKAGTGRITGPDGERSNLQIHIGPGCSEGCMLLPGGRAGRDSFQTSFTDLQNEDRRNGRGTAITIIVVNRNVQPVPSQLPTRLDERPQP